MNVCDSISSNYFFVFIRWFLHCQCLWDISRGLAGWSRSRLGGWGESSGTIVLYRRSCLGTSLIRTYLQFRLANKSSILRWIQRCKWESQDLYNWYVWIKSRSKNHKLLGKGSQWIWYQQSGNGRLDCVHYGRLQRPNPLVSWFRRSSNSKVIQPCEFINSLCQLTKNLHFAICFIFIIDLKKAIVVL